MSKTPLSAQDMELGIFHVFNQKYKVNTKLLSKTLFLTQRMGSDISLFYWIYRIKGGRKNCRKTWWDGGGRCSHSTYFGISNVFQKKEISEIVCSSWSNQRLQTWKITRITWQNGTLVYPVTRVECLERIRRTISQAMFDRDRITLVVSPRPRAEVCGNHSDHMKDN